MTKAPDGTMAGRVFKVGDQICDVDSTRVTDKGVCQTLIVSALKVRLFIPKRRCIMFLVEPKSHDGCRYRRVG